MQKNIIFHHPLPLAKNPKSGSQIRPIKMLEAFKELGYNVDLVVGYSMQREKAINDIKKKISDGKKYEFMYCENSTMPTQLTDTHHLPIRAFLDFSFFRFLKEKNIPIGLFYRDIYWRFDKGNTKSIKSMIAKFFYKYELKVYNQVLNKIYLPSINMKKHVPYIEDCLFDELPPASQVFPSLESKMENEITLIYVGGLSSHYDLTLLVDVLKNFGHLKLYMCTREIEWNKEKDKYGFLSDNISVIHVEGDKLLEYYYKSDVSVLFVKPDEYRDFAVPIKLFEYLGMQKPILASKGTLAGKFVAKNNIGWEVNYTRKDLENFLSHLDKQKIVELEINMKECAEKHSWKARAQKVVLDLEKII